MGVGVGVGVDNDIEVKSTKADKKSARGLSRLDIRTIRR